MFTCPNCIVGLKKRVFNRLPFWQCIKCSGAFVGLGTVNKLTLANTKEQIFKNTFNIEDNDQGKDCPSCRKSMIQIPADQGYEYEVDLCRRCYYLWFDSGELKLKQDPSKMPNTDIGHLNQHQINSYANFLASSSKYQTERDGITNDAPSNLKEFFGFMFGLPIEKTKNKIRIVPNATYLLTLVIVGSYLVSLFSGFGFESVIKSNAYIPSLGYLENGTRWFSSFFLHGGFFHLLGNVYFLFVFGDDVEQDLGPIGFIGLLTVSHVLGILLHSMNTISPDLPTIGASTGVFGVLTYYLLKFPKAKVVYFYWIIIRFIRLTLPVSIVFFAKIVMEMGLAYFGNNGGVAHWGHLGGVAAGALFAVLFYKGAARKARA